MTAFFKDRRLIYISSGLLIFIIVFAIGINLLISERKELEKLKEQRKEMMLLKGEYVSLKQKINTVESKKNLTNVQGVVQATDEVFSSIGLRDKVKTVKTTGKRETRDGFEEEADIYIEKVNMNEMVNIFYKTENAPMVLTIKKATIKKSFENPELFNISLIISFLKTK